MRNWQVIFYVRRDNSFDFPIWKQPPRYPRYESVAPRTTFYYGNFIRGRPTLISSVFDSHRNKLQFDLNRERGRDREREREREREKEAEKIRKKEGKNEGMQERRQGHMSTLQTFRDQWDDDERANRHPRETQLTTKSG